MLLSIPVSTKANSFLSGRPSYTVCGNHFYFLFLKREKNVNIFFKLYVYDCDNFVSTNSNVFPLPHLLINSPFLSKQSLNWFKIMEKKDTYDLIYN